LGETTVTINEEMVGEYGTTYVKDGQVIRINLENQIWRIWKGNYFILTIKDDSTLIEENATKGEEILIFKKL